MLFSSAANLVAFKMVLLFATSEAVIDMGKAKDTVRELFNSFTDTYLHFDAETISELIVRARNLTSDEKVDAYLVEIAQNENICKRMLETMYYYVENFRKLLNEVEVDGDQDSFIPMIKTLVKLQSMCQSQLERNTQYNAASTSGSGEADIRLNYYTFFIADIRDEYEIMAKLQSMRLSQPERNTQPNAASTSGSGEADIRDEYGFRIEQGKQEVKSLLDVFLQLALDAKCNNIQSLADFANFLLDDTYLYDGLLRIILTKPYLPFKRIIMSHIDKYMMDFQQILNAGTDDDVKLIPMEEILKSLRLKCVPRINRATGLETY